jgi:ABC-type transport system substrate-binding protein
VGFTLGDAPFYAAVYQELVEFNGSNFSQAVPVLASNYTISNNFKTFTFALRPGITFSNGEPVTAATVWFSLERINVIGQGPGVSNYVQLFYPGNYSLTGYSLPWGIGKAIKAATGKPTDTNVKLAANSIGNILSNFKTSNATIAKVMSYPNQALVVVNDHTIQINLLNPYSYFLLDLSAWWGAVQDPIFIDAHGGVQPNTVNAYLSNNPEPGTGPYVIKSYTPGTQIVLQADKNYWGNSQTNLPAVAQPAHIPVVVINYGEALTNRVQSFITNKAEISYVEPPSLNQVYSGYPQGIPSSSYLINTGPSYGTFWLSFNTQQAPMNNVDLRLALVHAVNLTSISHDVCKDLCSNNVGPISSYFKTFYNPGNLPVYSYNLTLAKQLINKSGWEAHFNVVTPDGTILGDPNAKILPPIPVTTVAPITSFFQAEFSVIQAGWQQIGVSTALQAQAAGVILPQMTSVAGTPLVFDGAWFPDWPDPIFQQMISNTGPSYGIAGNFAWYNNTQLNTMYQTLPFITDQSKQLSLVKQAYQTIYNEAPYLWLPNQNTYFLVQPYVKGFVFNPLMSYYYNEMYYPPSGY